MLRVALVLDDYNELIYLQTILRKIGIDVEGLQNVKKYEELSLGFNPQILIASAFGKKVNGLPFVKSLHRVRGFPKVILLTTQEHTVSEAEAREANVNLVLTSPLNPRNLILGLSQLGNVDEQILLDKFEKLQAGGFSPDETIQLVGQENAAIPAGGEAHRFSLKESPDSAAPQSSSTSFKLKKDVNSLASMPLEVRPEVEAKPSERINRYKEFLAKTAPLENPSGTSYKRDKIMQINKKIRSAARVEDIEQIENDRKEFVRQLFKK